MDWLPQLMFRASNVVRGDDVAENEAGGRLGRAAGVATTAATSQRKTGSYERLQRLPSSNASLRPFSCGGTRRRLSPQRLLLSIEQ